ncbi:transposase [Arthrobacter sp. PAMC25284]|uniref:transposase n=1 Tax=Arthrobacter sp. PAMC25284 TaxID=2861279 RepID=UPI001C6298F1|nr:transposase [Arthrobacter sp. PAMC25284]QYF89903.1 transposase [Arthrobacter sp. PAMC25284]
MEITTNRGEPPTLTGSNDRGTGFTAGIKTAALDPFRGYANAIRDEPPEAITVLDVFHVVKLACIS